jgi:hypothetical protein
MTAPLFVAVDEDEVPEAHPHRAGKYDGLIEAAFAAPGQWFKVARTFKTRQTAIALKKNYEDETDTDGNVVTVRPVETSSGWTVYVSVQPTAEQEPIED